jgi:hypothetical protein
MSSERSFKITLSGLFPQSQQNPRALINGDEVVKKIPSLLRNTTNRNKASRRQKFVRRRVSEEDITFEGFGNRDI